MLTIQPKQQTTLSFKGGLTPAIIARAGKIFVPGTEALFKKNYGVNANFEHNHAIAYCCSIVADIFETLTKKYNLPFGAMPPNIRVFKPGNVVCKGVDNALGFCLSDSQQVFPRMPEFEARSLFINDKYKTLKAIDSIAEENYRDKWNSTNHFLHTFIHEWAHNVHNDFLYRTFGYDGHCPLARQRYNSINGYYYDPNPYISGVNQIFKIGNTGYTPEAQNAIRQEISRYAAGEINPVTGEKRGGNPFEVVAETLTKKIIEVLNPKTLMPERNPFAINGRENALLQDIFNNAWHGIIGG